MQGRLWETLLSRTEETTRRTKREVAPAAPAGADDPAETTRARRQSRSLPSLGAKPGLAKRRLPTPPGSGKKKQLPTPPCADDASDAFPTAPPAPARRFMVLGGVTHESTDTNMDAAATTRNRASIVFQGPGGGGGEDAGELYEDPEMVERPARAAAAAADALNLDYDSPGEDFYDVPEENARACANVQEAAGDDDEHELYEMPERREAGTGTLTLPEAARAAGETDDDIYVRQKSMARRLRLAMNTLGDEALFVEFDDAAVAAARAGVGSAEDEYIQVTADDAAALETPETGLVRDPELSLSIGSPSNFQHVATGASGLISPPSNFQHVSTGTSGFISSPRRYGAPAAAAGAALEVGISPDIDDYDDYDANESGSEWESVDDSWDDTDEDDNEVDVVDPASAAAPPPLPARPPPALDTPTAKHNRRRRPRSRRRKASRGKTLNAHNSSCSRRRSRSDGPPPPPLPRSTPPVEPLSATERNRQKRTQEREDAQKRREARLAAAPPVELTAQLSAAERNRRKRAQEREDARKRSEARLAAKASTQAQGQARSAPAPAPRRPTQSAAVAVVAPARPAAAAPVPCDDWTTAADSMYDVRTVPATKAVLDGPAGAAAELAGLRKRPRPGGPASAVSVVGLPGPDTDLEGLEGMAEPTAPADSADISDLLHTILQSQSGRLDRQRSSNGPMDSEDTPSFSLSDATEDSADSDFYNPGSGNAVSGRARHNRAPSPAEFLLIDNEDTVATGLVVTTDYHTIAYPPRQPSPLGHAPDTTDPAAPPPPPRRHLPLPPALARPPPAEYVVKPAERWKQAPWRPQTTTPPSLSAVSPTAEGGGTGHDYRVDAKLANNTPHDYRVIAEAQAQAQVQAGVGYASARALAVEIDEASRHGLDWTRQDYYHGHLSRAEAKALIISMSSTPLPDGLFLLRSSSNSEGAVVSFVLGGQVRHSRVRNDSPHRFCLGDDMTAFTSMEALVASHDLLKFPLKTVSSGC